MMNAAHLVHVLIGARGHGDGPRSSIHRSLLILGLLAAAAPSVFAQVPLETIALTATVAPDTGGALFQAPFYSQADSSGRIFLQADLLGPGVDATNDRGFWTDDGVGVLRLIARQGDAVPGAPLGAIFGADARVFASAGNDAGDLAMATTLEIGHGGVTGTDDSILLGPDGMGGLVVVAREGDSAPGTPPGAIYESFSVVGLNSLGEIAYGAELAVGPGGISASDNLRIFGPDASGTNALRQTEGDSINMLDGSSAQSFTLPGSAQFLARVGMNDSRQIYTSVPVRPFDSQPGYCQTRSSVDGSLDGYRLEPPGTTAVSCFGVDRPLARTDQLTGFNPALILETFWRASEDGSSFAGLVSAQQPFAALVSVHFKNVLSSLVVDDPFAPAYTLSVDNTTVAVSGAPYPGSGDPIVTIEYHEANALGDVLFPAASLADSGLHLWTRANGNITTIVEIGDSVEVAPSDFRTVADLTYYALADSRQAIIGLDFDDGSSGVFRSAAVVDVPAASEAAILVLAVMLALGGAAGIRGLRGTTSMIRECRSAN